MEVNWIISAATWLWVLIEEEGGGNHTLSYM